MDNNSLLDSNKEFSDIYQRNVDTVYRLCYMYLKNSSDAEDAVQSIFMKLLRANKTFENLEYEKAWLLATSKNFCKDILKSGWKSRRVSVENIPEAAYWDKSEISNEILDKLLSLPTKYKEVLYLYYYEGYSVKDIARILQRKESTIQSQLFNGRKRLKMSIGGEYLG